MQVLIVEDEILLAKQLQKLLAVVAQDAVVAGITHSIHDTIQWLQSNPKPDLILMDIELADGQSFDIFQSVIVTSHVIFTTAYDEYAIKAFKVNSIDYLLKPVKKEELAAAIQKFKMLKRHEVNIDALLYGIKTISSGNPFRERFLVKIGQKLISIDVHEVAYIFSEKGMSYVRTKQNQKYIVDYTMDQLEKMLSPQQFFRANRQFIISSQAVVAIYTWFNQKLKVELKPEITEPVIISRDKANAFNNFSFYSMRFNCLILRFTQYSIFIFIQTLQFYIHKMISYEMENSYRHRMPHGICRSFKRPKQFDTNRDRVPAHLDVGSAGIAFKIPDQ